MSRSDRRSAARLAAAQALYQMEVADKGLADILAEFEAHWIGQEVEGDQYNPAELAFFRDVVSGVLARPVARSTAASTTRSPKAGRSSGSRR